VAHVQTYANHTQRVPAFHFVTVPLLLATFIGSWVNWSRSSGDLVYSASLLMTLSLGVLILSILARVFALRAQDRAIRAEEQLRHYVLTGKLLDSRLTIRQIIALRFASDQEFPALAERAAHQQMSEKDIKKAIAHWRPDTYRV
jgi:hypothetical protein